MLNVHISHLLKGNLEGLSLRELVAVQFKKAMGTDPQKLAMDEKFCAEIKEVFSNAEIIDLTHCIAGWMGMGRVAHVLSLDSNCSI